MPVFSDYFEMHWVKIMHVRAKRNLHQWVNSVFFPPLCMHFTPKISAVSNFATNSRRRRNVFLNLKSLFKFERDIGGAYV